LKNGCGWFWDEEFIDWWEVEGQSGCCQVDGSEDEVGLVVGVDAEKDGE